MREVSSEGIREIETIQLSNEIVVIQIESEGNRDV
jgi:hypothetical protein